MSKLLHFFTRISFGKELAMALMILKLISDALRDKNPKNVAVFVFRKLPAQWRHPEGPATEKEFVDLVDAGQLFLKRIQALVTP